MGRIKVLIVDDSMLFRMALTRELSRDPDIEVVGEAGDPFEARDKILALKPDVMVLDVGMPKMDGIEFLRRLLPQYPIPVVVSSGMEGKVFDAMAAGAVDFVPKPSVGQSMEDYSKGLILTVKVASEVKLRLPRPAARPGLPAQRRTTGQPGQDAGFSEKGGRGAPHEGDAIAKATQSLKDRSAVIAIGASTGGTEAIYSVLTQLPASLPGIVMVQHMPPGFTVLYAERLNRDCALRVREATDGERVEPGLALLAPAGDRQMKLMRDARGYFVKLLSMDKVSGHRPSADVLFDSTADAAGDKAVGVLLTGMGADGANGLFKMRDRGALTIGQDKESCVVYGMPKVAYEIGAVAKQLPLSAIPREIIDWARRR